MKITIRKWRSVASWHWDVADDCCGICRNAFDATCPDCKVPGDDCPPVFGQCNHPFHMHCIVKWLEQQAARDQCPMCRQDWQFKQEAG